MAAGLTVIGGVGVLAVLFWLVMLWPIPDD